MASSTIEICVLAGGLSTRMGRDKSSARVGGQTMLSRVRSAARMAGLRVRVIRKDIVPRCGPIGGIFTALKSSQAAVVVILPCDMPFLAPALIQSAISSLRDSDGAVFTIVGAVAGFPCVFRRDLALPIVERQIARSNYSLQSLAKALRSRLIRPRRKSLGQLANINTPSELQTARQRFRQPPPGPTRRVKPHNSPNHGLSNNCGPFNLKPC
jgi:molybdopterin-guanine dinucleotide biosynthesis protein A